MKRGKDSRPPAPAVTQRQSGRPAQRSDSGSHLKPGTAPQDKPRTPNIREAPRFRRKFEALGPAQTRLVIGALYDFVRRIREVPQTFRGGYDEVAQLKPKLVLKLDVAGALRLLVHSSSSVFTLLDVGDRRIVGSYPGASLDREVQSAVPARRGFWPDPGPTLRFFGQVPDVIVERFGPEFEAEWVYFLTAHQQEVVEPIEQAIREASVENPRFFFIVGGPGTGKTVLLLKLLLDLSSEGLDPWIRLSDEVANYVEDGGGIPIRQSRVAGQMSPMTAQSIGVHVADILLVDDPNGVEDIRRELNDSIGYRRAVVVAFDPCQLEEASDLDDQTYTALLSEFAVEAYPLRQCYRQKANLGAATKRVADRIAASSPYVDHSKVTSFKLTHDLVYSLANDIEFPNPHGYEFTYEHPSEEDVRKEVRRIRTGPLWKHWKPVVIVEDQRLTDTPWAWHRLLVGVPHVRITTAELDSIKGLEFQHAILVVSRSLFQELENGFEGSGTREYHRRRRLRIPFSRAKDSLVTLVADDDRARTRGTGIARPSPIRSR